MSKLVPKYTFWDGLNVALTLGMQALEEIRALARIPGPAGRDGANGRDGTDGVNGKDGIGFDDIQMELNDGGRTLVIKVLNAGQVLKSFDLQTMTALWRGPFDRSREYQPGDMATWNGSIWHCNVTSKGEIGSDRWSLAVKKGRDSDK